MRFYERFSANKHGWRAIRQFILFHPDIAEAKGYDIETESLLVFYLYSAFSKGSTVDLCTVQFGNEIWVQWQVSFTQAWSAITRSKAMPNLKSI